MRPRIAVARGSIIGKALTGLDSGKGTRACARVVAVTHQSSQPHAKDPHESVFPPCCCSGVERAVPHAHKHLRISVKFIVNAAGTMPCCGNGTLIPSRTSSGQCRQRHPARNRPRVSVLHQ
jgi:hypothetical protein